MKLPGTRSSGEEWFAPLTVTEHRMFLTRDLKQLASGWRLTGEPLSGTPTLLQKGVMGFFPSVWQSPNPFSSRGKSRRLGYQVSIANVTHVLPVLGF